MSLWTTVLRNLNTWVQYSNTSIRSNQGTHFDLHRFLVYDVADSYLTLIEKFKAFKKVYVTTFDYSGRLASISNWSINFSSYILTLYDSMVRGRFWYFLNSWVYTTNHKRIAVNYFWFVIFAGICGMSLATIIRLEMAYPGVGILAGDSLQYLSVVTAHAVVMVFFMIMPLLFGAFGNFLLPTQLGVHDVAFPRLNSAAFWFLPGGLIMLCQLLCLDRRYQRMNCFNVRELQALLKNRFFNELTNSRDHHEFLDQTAIGIRFKTNNLDTINSNILLLYRYGVTSDPQVRFQSYDGMLCGKFPKEALLDKTGVMWKLMVELNSLATSILFNKIYQLIFAFLTATGQATSLSHPNTSFSLTWNNWFESLSNFTKNEVERISNIFFQLPVFAENLLINLYSFLSSLSHYVYYKHIVTLGGLKCSFWDLIILTKNSEFTPRLIMTFEASYYNSFGYIVDLVIKTFASIYFSFTGFTPFPFLLPISETKNIAEKGRLLFQQYNLSPSSHTNMSIEQTSLFYVGVAQIFSDLLWSPMSQFFITSRNLITSIFHPLSLLTVIKNTLVDIVSFLPKFHITAGYPSVTDLKNQVTFLNSFIKPQLISPQIKNQLSFSLDSITLESFSTNQTKSLEETSSVYRSQRNQNPVFKPDFKSGNFFTRDDFSRKPFLLTTISDISKGMRRPSWIFSDVYADSLKNLQNTYFNFFTDASASPKSDTKVSETFIHNPYGFFNTFHLFSTAQVFDTETKQNKPQELAFVNQRWLSLNALDQKFYRMYNTMSTQQRVVSNWRQLKFSREGWRCRLLSARHQKTLFRRYVKEDGMLWSFERNAKDVLPGWAMITPFSARTRFTAIGKVDIGLMGVFLVLNSSIVSSANFLVTYRYLSTLNNRKMRDARSFFTEGVIVASWMMIAANPMLAIGIIMLLSDRHWQTSFFDYSGGGDTVLFQHMFWFFGHPEVYVIMIPAFGFTNTILSYYLRKRVSARASLLYSMYTIAFLGFFVWGHHMYMVGLAHTTRMLFSTLTVMISVPAATKLMHWCVTLVNSTICMELPFMFTLLFIFFFVSGGISGMAVAHTGMDILFHDSFYVVGHFHVMFAGSAMFGSFAAFYFYFPAIFGCKYSRIWGYLHCIYYLLGQLMTVVPMLWLGYGGMPRRVLDYPAALGGWHAITSAGHLLSVAGMLAFFIMIFDSHRQFRAATLSTLGVSRFSIRLSFYLYEISRVRRLTSRWGLNISSYNFSNSVHLNELNFVNKEPLETTLYSYTFVSKK